MTNLDYLFGEAEPLKEGDEIAPGTTVKRVLRCVQCILPDKMLDSIYCAEKRYWIEENANDVIPHCQIFEIPKEEEIFLKCEDCECESCDKECVANENIV